MTIDSIEMSQSREYLERALPESPLNGQLERITDDVLFFIPEGFEERSLGALRVLANNGVTVRRIFLGRYVGDPALNLGYRQEFERLAGQVSNGNLEIVDNRDDGRWVSDAAAKISGGKIVVDITGLSNRGIFGALDALASEDREVMLTYSEAETYWPTKDEWERIQKEIAGAAGDELELAQRTDDSTWLYGGEHSIGLIANHEGYDVAGSRALVAFLPFKSARLAAVVGGEEYSEYLFIAGRPRLAANCWRLDVLRRVNANLVKVRDVIEVSTFGYRDTVKLLSRRLFGDGGLLESYDVHLAPIGSKLQTVACWICSRIAPAITVVSSIPSQYYPKAFSEGVGGSWIFSFVRP